MPDILEFMKDLLRNYKHAGQSSQIIEKAAAAIHDISEIVAGKTKIRIPEAKVLKISYQDLAEIQGVSVSDNQIHVKGAKSDQVYSFPIPTSTGVIYKGGLPRLLLKLYANAPQSTIEPELPLNDIDLLVRANDPVADHEVEQWRAHPVYGKLIESNGVEKIPEIVPSHIVVSRDMTLNSCFLAKDGLYFSTSAYKDAHVGRMEPLGVGRALFGPDCFYHHGLKLLKNSGMMRFIKTLTEGKGLFFEIPLRNTSIDMGIYWLVLARKFMRKQNGGQLLQIAYHIGKQAGQVREGEKSIFDVLDRVHKKYSFFEFSSESLDALGSLRWLSKKLLRQITRSFRKSAGYERQSGLLIFPGDEHKIRVSFPENMGKLQSEDAFRHEWQLYMDRCDLRRRQGAQESAF